jgi:Trypsin-like peptidase domain
MNVSTNFSGWSITHTSGQNSAGLLAQNVSIAKALRVASATATQVGSGSGVIVARDKNNYYILTNAHVVVASGSDIKVTMPGGESLNGRVIKTGSGAFGSGSDLAIVLVTNTRGGAFATAPIRRSGAELGSTVLQVGYPNTSVQRGNALNDYGRGGRFIGTTVTEVTGSPIEGGYALGLGGNLGVGSSGGGIFDADGKLAAIYGRSQSGTLSSRRENGNIHRPQSERTTGWGIPSNEIMGFLRGVVRGF